MNIWSKYDRYKNIDLMEESIVDQLLENNDQCIYEGLEDDLMIFSTYNLMNENTDSPHIERKTLKFNCFTGVEIKGGK